MRRYDLERTNHRNHALHYEIGTEIAGDAMSKLEVAEKKKSIKANLACIYGPTVKGLCSVRTDLENREDVAKQYLKPQQGLEALSSMMDNLSEALTSSIRALADFCGHCPYLHAFEEHMMREAWEERRLKKRRLPRKK